MGVLPSTVPFDDVVVVIETVDDDANVSPDEPGPSRKWLEQCPGATRRRVADVSA